MSPSTYRIAVATLSAAAMLATPLSIAPAAAQPAPRQVAAASTASHEETVEQRIATLHQSLKITAAEEADWNAVAQAMRDNAAAMDKLVEERDSQAAQSMTAVDDLNSYQKFAQAHADGLKNLIAAFDTLYNAMPEAQKKVADQVFGNARHQAGQAHS
jgi:hypothetical protein